MDLLRILDQVSDLQKRDLQEYLAVAKDDKFLFR